VTNPLITVAIRGGTVVNSNWSRPADVLISGNQIAAVVEPGRRGEDRATDFTEIDATGRLVLPGGVDPHCHVGFTSGEYTTRDDYYEATRAAVAGGTTTIVDFAIPRPGEQPLAVAERQREKASDGMCDSALHACVVEWDGTTQGQLEELAHSGIVTVKMFTTYRDETMASPTAILNTMKVLRPLGGLVYVHCESNHLVEDRQEELARSGELSSAHHHQSRSELAELASVSEILALADHAKSPVYFVHQSSAAAVELAIEARKRGVRAFSESVTHHLLIDDSKYSEPNAELYVCCPPLRAKSTVDALTRHLFTGGITTVGSDHCCYDSAQKKSSKDDVRTMPNGLPGVETRLPLLFSHFVIEQQLPIERFVELTSTNPARLNGIYPRKGAILPGSDADISIWSREGSHVLTNTVLHMSTDYTPFEGSIVRGTLEMVLVKGQPAVHQGEFLHPTARGVHVPGEAMSPDPLLGSRGRKP